MASEIITSDDIQSPESKLNRDLTRIVSAAGGAGLLDAQPNAFYAVQSLRPDGSDNPDAAAQKADLADKLGLVFFEEGEL